MVINPQHRSLNKLKVFYFKIFMALSRETPYQSQWGSAWDLVCSSPDLRLYEKYFQRY